SGGSGGNGLGTVFQMTPAGVLTTLAVFDDANGAFSYAGVIQGRDGNLYGTASEGGTFTGGVIFQLIAANGGYVFTPPLVQVAIPTFSPPAGSFASAQTVTISSATNGVSLAYTTDGSTPTENGGIVTHGTLLYNGGTVAIGGSTGYITLEAIAFSPGFADSAVATDILPADTPTFSPPAGTYTSGQMVTISSATGYTTIVYTTDGSTPTESNGLASNGQTLQNGESIFIGGSTSNITLKAMAIGYGQPDSAVATGAYTILPAATPTFSPPAGTYTSGQMVTISSANGYTTIVYTTDGSTPTESNGLASNGQTLQNGQSIFIGGSTGNITLKAIAIGYGQPDSAVAIGVYDILPPATPTFSPPAGTYSSAQSVTIGSTTNDAVIFYTTDGSTPTITNGTLLANGGSVSIVGTTTTLKAIAVVFVIEGCETNTSAVTAGVYTISGSTPIPTTPQIQGSNGTRVAAQKSEGLKSPQSAGAGAPFSIFPRTEGE
ncbi:MAG: chitobiase/beta-hexosaminidase C-terminal domain-containing protein, partial [Opitutaceae bacterium]